jgi:hypothetical protein
MKIEEYNAIMKDIVGAMADPAKVDIPKITANLTKLTDDYNAVSVTLDNTQKEAQKNKEAYENAIAYNMQLFRERAVKPAETTVIQSEDKKKSFSDLDLSNL